eukprot:TRINITY_DN893_c0_g1_i1.p1 TRINITY_DN893_c0_g1~~TRINITY_DN893_c0_g1_i1.p1  ORF type:complete len:187 (-),score=25.19 TRINITY_DN893_c0_g1_i1:153-713(-)
MRVSVFAGLFLLFAFANAANKFQSCKEAFDKISNHPIVTTRNPTLDFVNQNVKDVYQLIDRVLNTDCKEAVEVLLGGKQETVSRLYKANYDLKRNADGLKQRFTNVNEPVNFVKRIWTNYVQGFRTAAISHFYGLAGGDRNSLCYKKTLNLDTTYPVPIYIREVEFITKYILYTYQACLHGKTKSG